MNRIEGITDKPKQQMTISLDDGTPVSLLIEYRPNQLGWFYDLSVGGFVLNGQRLVTSPDLLRKFRNILPFTLAVLTTNNVEPMNQQDFADGTAKLYLLEGEDRDAVNAAVYPGD
jgi:hypothetical protein